MKPHTFLKLAVILSLLFATASCHKEKHFISDKDYRTQVHNDFLKRRALALGRSNQLFDGMDTLDTETREALEFLYAYMPYSDLADYDQAFYLQQIKTAFNAREIFSWGKEVPEDIFRHFVLVYRVNNENLDTARLLMQKELAPRLEGLSMYEAALEVNHWCHEHVAYRASDSRTSAPLATMRTSLGRCGEESTFAVTALRSVGIPARQCYTPRWAHCDDNHAWVEVWVDGKWYYLGACEPDAELNMGWFSVPSTRCMMVHSKAFGRYHGDEEVVKQTAFYSELNLLSHYAPTKKITIKVFDNQNKPAVNAIVRFKLYNYSEFYPLATLKTDKEGKACLTTGLGDLLIWATDSTFYNYVKMDVREEDEIEIYMTREGFESHYVHPRSEDYVEMIDIAPPMAGEAKVTPSKDKTDANAKRLLYEDSVRNTYMATFPTREKCSKYDDNAWGFIHKSEGNYKEIMQFIDNHLNDISYNSNSHQSTLLYDYLASFSDKDLRDITAETLEAHYTYQDRYPYEIFKKGILPTRISNEMVRPWREFLSEKMKDIKDYKSLIAWTMENIFVDDTGNYYNCPISPRGVYELKHSDPHSRDIFFVAACRSLQIPAYLDNATNMIYIWEHDSWNAFSFKEPTSGKPAGTLTLTYKPTKELTKPVYWSHFTLAKYSDGDFTSFDFEEDPRMSTMPTTIQLEPGYYCLTTGNRYPNGDVLARVEYFTVKEGDIVTKEIILRPLVEQNNDVQGVINPKQEIIADMATLADYAGSTGMLFVFVGDYKEPSKHLIKEMQALSKEYAKWGGMIYLVAPATAKPTSWKLPNADYMICQPDNKDPFEKQIVEALKINLKNDYPLVALVNKKGEILFHSHGYSIGLAEQILKHCSKLVQ